MALGDLIIKALLGLTDEELVEQIKENPYLQFLIGLLIIQTRSLNTNRLNPLIKEQRKNERVSQLQQIPEQQRSPAIITRGFQAFS